MRDKIKKNKGYRIGRGQFISGREVSRRRGTKK